MVRRRHSPAALALAIVLLVGSTSCGNGDDTDHLTVSAPRVDFGKILRGTKVVRSVVLRNGGTGPVAIQGTKANCACFTLHPIQRMLQAGEEREVKVTFNSWDIDPGLMLGKRLTIASNDWFQPLIEVALEGEIVASCIISPEKILDLGRMQRGDKHVVKVRPGAGMRMKLGEDDWRITRAQALEARRIVLPEDGGYDIEVRVREDAQASNPFLAALELNVEFEGQGYPAMKLNCVIKIHGEWQP